MELINATRMVAGYTMGLSPAAASCWSSSSRARSRFPAQGEAVRLHDEQLPLVMADMFTGEPGSRAPMYEIDFAPRKPRCDVLLNGSAHAPGGQASDARARSACGSARGRNVRRGRRSRLARGLGEHRAPRAPAPFTHDADFLRRALRRRRSATRRSGASTLHIMPNPVGRGFHKHLSAWVDGMPLPNTEELGRGGAPDGIYRPMAFGPVGRAGSRVCRHLRPELAG